MRSRSMPTQSKQPSEFGCREVFLNEHELAERHKRSVRTVRNERLRGAGVPFVRIGRSIRYRLSDVVRYESERLCTSTSSKGGEL